MIAKFRAFTRLAPPARRLFVVAWMALLGAEFGLRVFGLKRCEGWMRLLRVGRQCSLSQSESKRRVQQLSDAVDLAARHHMVKTTCLRQALALQWLLIRKGIPSDLRLGARRVEGEFEFHAWLEQKGQVLGHPGKLAPLFAPLSSLEHPSRV